MFTKDEILAFLHGESANYGSAAPLRVDARDLETEEGTLTRLIEQTPAGRSVSYVLSVGEFSARDKQDIRLTAAAFVLLAAKGKVEVFIDDSMIRADFLARELPLLLRNRKVEEINGAPREALSALYDADRDISKYSSHKLIIRALRERELHEGLGPEDLSTKELAALEQVIAEQIERTFAPLLKRETVTHIDLARAELAAESLRSEKQVLGLRLLLPNVRLRVFLEGWKNAGTLRDARHDLQSHREERMRVEKGLLSPKNLSHIEKCLKENEIDLRSKHGAGISSLIKKEIKTQVVEVRAEQETIAQTSKERPHRRRGHSI